jgi:hypothetical protein
MYSHDDSKAYCGIAAYLGIREGMGRAKNGSPKTKTPGSWPGVFLLPGPDSPCASSGQRHACGLSALFPSSCLRAWGSPWKEVKNGLQKIKGRILVKAVSQVKGFFWRPR